MGVRPHVNPLDDSRSWLMLVHQLPPDPPALRVRVWRRLQSIGALQLKSSIYLLPDGDATLEDFEWLVQEIRRSGGEASVWRASTVEASDEEIVGAFHAAITAEYEDLEADLREWQSSSARTGERTRTLARLHTRFANIGARDHFGAPRREVVGALLDALQHDADAGAASDLSAREHTMSNTRGMTWVTRTNVKIDRMTSAWLIRRFIDPQARFVFTQEKHYVPKEGELRFDMYEGEYTHEGDLCTFEVLLRRFELDDPGLRRLAEIVHDVDLKDDRYAHAETAGVAAVLAGLVRRIPDDAERIDAVCTVLDGLIDQLRSAAAPA